MPAGLRPWVALSLGLSSLVVGAWITGPATARSQRRIVQEQAAVVWISPGWFTRGATEREVAWAIDRCRRDLGLGNAARRCPRMLFEWETPVRRIYLDAFGIDRVEVSRERYARCVFAGVCAPPNITGEDARIARPSHPATGVTHTDAARYCGWAGGRLPTESEWERAARGRGRARRFPWGNNFNDRVTNHGLGGRSAPIDGFRYAAPVGSFPDGASPDGVLDMAGNAMEWTHDRFDVDAYGTGPRVNPQGPRFGGERIVRGGSWRTAPYALRVTARLPVAEGARAPDLGFRCAYDAPNPAP